MAGLLSDDEEGITKKPPGTESKMASEKSAAPVRDQGKEGGLVARPGQVQLAQPETLPGRDHRSQILDQEIISVSEQEGGTHEPAVGQGRRSCVQTRHMGCLQPHPEVRVSEKHPPSDTSVEGMVGRGHCALCSVL